MPSRIESPGETYLKSEGNGATIHDRRVHNAANLRRRRLLRRLGPLLTELTLGYLADGVYPQYASVAMPRVLTVEPGDPLREYVAAL